MVFLLLQLHNMSRIRNRLPYQSHPLYKLRLTMIFAVLAGFVFNLITISNSSYTGTGPFIISLILLFLSLVLVLYDIFTWAINKGLALVIRTSLSLPPTPPHTNMNINRTSLPPLAATSQLGYPKDNGYKWPSTKLVVLDFILAVFLQWLFWAEFAYLPFSGYYSESKILGAYADLANLVVSVLHAVVWWKEVMARKKQAWRKEVEVGEGTPCERCGYICEGMEQDGEEDKSSGGHEGASVLESLTKGKVILPKWARDPDVRDMESETGKGNVESLLVTPEESCTEIGGPSGYGTLEKSVCSVPETVVKKKEKGKKRLVEVA
ncbi:hypothetical protein CC78DRAFT_564868 [Lojkania enalia]|uniref:Uncharacterized protein n=1 Tax=Lojkania enalia TaxID=147567 RepID=A0A9P4N9L4_9PLEO|nr:hypothetical protein CC78DRAFT_564868 [Didymosphaeria enalia]